MAFLVDENVPDSIALFLRERGHDVRLVRDRLAAGTPDEIIAIAANEHDAIVVTFDKDFGKLLPHSHSGRRFKRAGRLTLKCKQPLGQRRIERLIDSIEFEYQQCARSGCKFMMEITPDTFHVFR